MIVYNYSTGAGMYTILEQCG